MDPACNVCAAASDYFRTYTVLGKYAGEYRRCGTCGYVFIANPHWLDEAYASAIAALDTGIVARNLWLADATCALLGLAFSEVRHSMDYGGGSGLLVRLLRDRGHDFYWHDPFSPNLLAIGFDADLTQRYDMLTAFELVEHLSDPLAGFDTLHQLAPIIVFSTELLPDPAPAPGMWWYYAPEAGQHIGFFTQRSLAVIGERLGLQLSSNGRNLHVLAPKQINRKLLQALRKPGPAHWLAPFGRRRSLAHADAVLLEEKLRSEHSEKA